MYWVQISEKELNDLYLARGVLTMARNAGQNKIIRDNAERGLIIIDEIIDSIESQFKEKLIFTENKGDK